VTVAAPSRLIAVALVAAASLAACGGKKEVGSGLTASNKGGAGDFGTTTTVAAVPLTLATTTTKPAVVATTAKPVATTARPTTTVAATTTTVKQLTVTISASGFDPQTLRVYVGQSFTYKNADTQARGVKDQGNRFQSGPIAPGASWTFAIPQAGTFQIADSTRPFVVGTIQVVPR
jgi:plastocyanin